MPPPPCFAWSPPPAQRKCGGGCKNRYAVDCASVRKKQETDLATPSLQNIRGRLRLPLIAAPMFLVSGVELVVAACENGVIGAFPSPNCRSPDPPDGWMEEIGERLRRHSE